MQTMTEEEEIKPTAEVNPDALEAVFAEEEVLIEDEVFLAVTEDDEDDAARTE